MVYVRNLQIHKNNYNKYDTILHNIWNINIRINYINYP